MAPTHAENSTEDRAPMAYDFWGLMGSAHIRPVMAAAMGYNEASIVLCRPMP